MDSETAILTETATRLTEPAEGFSAKPYQDSAGVWTYLYGSTRDPYGNQVTAKTPPGTPALGQQLMIRDLRSALQTVKGDVTASLDAGEEAALTDFVYNEGSGNFAKSTVLKCLNAGDYAGACAHLADWNEAGGVVLAGLVKRRAAEQVEFKA